jgi:hypothetical protein
LLREARLMPSDNRRRHIEAKARHEFKAHRSQADAGAVAFQVCCVGGASTARRTGGRQLQRRVKTTAARLQARRAATG